MKKKVQLKVQLNLHLKIRVHLKVHLEVHMKIKVYMNLQMNLFLHMKFHMKVLKRLQVRVHEGWAPSLITTVGCDKLCQRGLVVVVGRPSLPSRILGCSVNGPASML